MAISFSIGLVPSFHLVALQAALLFLLLPAALHGRSVLSNLPRLGWPHVMMLQFVLYFGLNIWLYPSLEGNIPHLRSVAFESYGMTLFGFVVIRLYLGRGHDVMVPLQHWIPVGLFVSFCVMTFFVFGPQGARAQAFSTNALVPPMWYLTLTLICFCGFSEMTRGLKISRLTLLGAAAVMCLYSGGRMILIIWLLCALVLGLYLLQIQRRHTPLWKNLLLVLSALFAALLLLYVIDDLSGRTLVFRFTYTFEKIADNGLTRQNFYRLELWSAAWQVIERSLPFGAGQVNERLLIHRLILRDWWFTAHQTYLSYLISGGWVALASGLVFQSAGYRLFTREMLPAALGIVLVLALNGLTDLVFQSFFTVQLYMLLLMFTLHSQRQRNPE